jgi:hypothetical protein
VHALFDLKTIEESGGPLRRNNWVRHGFAERAPDDDAVRIAVIGAMPGDDY